MSTEEFIKDLQKVSELMKKEKYRDAIVIIEKLKEIEKKGDFDYSLTHQLYQYHSNAHSLYNQEIILKSLEEISGNTVSFEELTKKVQDLGNVDLDYPNLKKEIELLILRGKLNCKIQGEKLIR